MNKNFKTQYTETLTDKQAANLAAWQRWGEKMKMLRAIHVELGRTDAVIEEVISDEQIN